MKFRKYFGYIKEDKIESVYPDTYPFTDTLDLKIEYLKALDAQEGSRQATIETKTSQLIGQAGIIFSLLSLFIANYISKFSVFPGLIQGLLIFFFLVILFFYLSTIFVATRYMNIAKYAYGQRSVTTVQAKFNTDDDFKIEEIKDLIYSIDRNTKVNNQKSNNLIYAYRSFIVGTVAVGLLSILLISSGYFIPKPEAAKVRLEDPIILKNLDETLNKLENRPVIIIHDTVYRKLK